VEGAAVSGLYAFFRISGCSESLIYRLEGEIILVLTENMFSLNNNEGYVLAFPVGMRLLSNFSTSLIIRDFGKDAIKTSS
jgi:hypothetical protein